MATVRRAVEAADVRGVLDLAHAVWKHDAARLGFEASYGTLAWEGPRSGRARVFERAGTLVGWARLNPGYDRIRRPGAWDVAPPMLAWLVDTRRPDAMDVLVDIVRWAEARTDAPFTTSHAEGDDDAARTLADLGYRPDATEPFGIYLQQELASSSAERVHGECLFTTMAELDDAELRAAAHRVAWDGSTRSADDVRATMAQWPYRADLDVVALAQDGQPAGSAIVWFDESYEYGELEPVGVAPEHRGTGMAAAMLRFALATLYAAGASHAVVGARGDDDYPTPRHLYASVGFEVFTRQQVVRAT